MRLTEFLDHEEPFIQEMAILAQRVLVDFQLGKITQSEYDELIADITDLKKLNDIATNLEHKIKLQMAMDALIKAIGVIKAVL